MGQYEMMGNMSGHLGVAHGHGPSQPMPSAHMHNMVPKSHAMNSVHDQAAICNANGLGIMSPSASSHMQPMPMYPGHHVFSYMQPQQLTSMMPQGAQTSTAPVVTSMGHSPEFNHRDWGALDTPQPSSDDTSADQGIYLTPSSYTYKVEHVCACVSGGGGY